MQDHFFGNLRFRENAINLFFFWGGGVKRVPDWGPEHRESNLTVHCLLGWSVACKATGGRTTVQRLVATVWRFGVWWFFRWRGSWTACRSAYCFVFGGDVVDGRHYWWPYGLFQDFWDFSPRRKILENHFPCSGNGKTYLFCFYYK